MLDVKCPNCGQLLALPEETTALACRCPMCQAVFSPPISGTNSDTRIAPSQLHISANSPPSSSEEGEDYDLDVFVERARFRREMEDEREGRFPPPASWQPAKIAAKHGSAIGLAIGVMVTLVFVALMPKCWGSYGAICGMLAVNATVFTVFGAAIFGLCVKNQAYRCAIAISVLQGSLIVAFLYASDEFDSESAMAATLIGSFSTFLLSLFAFVCFSLAMIFFSRKRGRPER
jgi:phage FluMu protein Com